MSDSLDLVGFSSVRDGVTAQAYIPAGGWLYGHGVDKLEALKNLFYELSKWQDKINKNVEKAKIEILELDNMLSE